MSVDSSPTPASPPLDGILVVSVEQAVAAPMCSGLLANAGARVIKVERPEGDFARAYDDVVHGESAYFVWLNGGKESAVINLKEEAEREFLERLLAEADVFIQNLSPGAMARYGFGADELRSRHPRLITVDISGYGESGEYAQMKAYDLLIQGETGLASITGTPEQPGRTGISICDIACGMYAYAAVLEALLQRGRTGLGDAIKVSLFDAAANWMTVPLLHHDYGSAAPARVGLRHPSIAPYGVFSASDGEQLLISVQNQAEWKSFCETVLDAPELASASGFASNIDRVSNRTALDEAIAARLSEVDVSELVGRLRLAKIAFGRLNSVGDLSDHPQLRRTRVGAPSGDFELVAHPVHHSSWSPSPVRSPALGEHDSRIRAEFGAKPDRVPGDRQQNGAVYQMQENK